VGITPRHRDRIPLAIRMGILYPHPYPNIDRAISHASSMAYSPTTRPLPLPDFFCSTSGSRLTSWDGLTSAPAAQRGQSLHKGGRIEKRYCIGAYWHGATLLGPDTRTLPPILAEPLSGPRSSVRFAAICARVFRFSFFAFARFVLGTSFGFSFSKNLRITFFQDFAKRKNDRAAIDARLPKTIRRK
jgi:hypothetical protein